MSTEGGVRVTVRDLASGAGDEAVIADDYVLVTSGTCHRTHTNVSHAKDGTQTHVVTIRGIRKPVSG